jgi:hypothetical protein
MAANGQGPNPTISMTRIPASGPAMGSPGVVDDYQNDEKLTGMVSTS